MLKEKLAHTIEQQPIALFSIEKEYAERNGLLSANQLVQPKQWDFSAIELCLKETEEMLEEKWPSFMNEPVYYFGVNIDQFVYVESEAFTTIGVDAMAIEMDDVFQTITVLFGLKLQKKWGAFIKEHLEANVGLKTYSAMFSDQDGLWDINIPLDALEGFHKELPIKDAIDLAYRFIFNMLAALEATN